MSMNVKNVLMLFAGAVVGIMATALIASSAVNSQNYGMMRMMGMQRGWNMPNSTVDQHFIEQMVLHHDDAITMANIALQKTERTEIKTLAQDIVNAQSKEINEMSQWYRNWYGREVPDSYAGMGHGMGSGNLHMGMMGSAVDAQKLETASPFDKAFIEEMIPHHQMAIAMAQMLKNSTQRPEMKKLADDIITAQNKEIEQMRAWYNQWYR